MLLREICFHIPQCELDSRSQCTSMQAVCQSNFDVITYLKIVHCSWNSALADLPKRKKRKISLQTICFGKNNTYLVTIDMKDWDYSPTFSWVDILHRVNRRTAKPLILTLCACHAVAVGPVSLSPSPITATVIWLGLSMILLVLRSA